MHTHAADMAHATNMTHAAHAAEMGASAPESSAMSTTATTTTACIRDIGRGQQGDQSARRQSCCEMLQLHPSTSLFPEKAQPHHIT
jgi:hypothetical protein